MKVLIAEDDPFSRRFLAKTLSEWGYEIEEVSDGNSALDALNRDDAPQLLLLDWMMPGADGLEVCRRLRERNTGRPFYVIMLTAKGAVEDLVQAMDAGADDYTTKSFDVRELQVRLRAGERILSLEESLHRMATRDSLTGLLNRPAILDVLEKELSRAEREYKSTGLILCDIDHFKRVNDVHGHAAGDAVLVKAAGCLANTIRKYDVSGRYGGEEFLVVLPHAGLAETVDVAERLRTRVATGPIEVNGESIAITASFGAVATDEVGPVANADAIIQLADVALYRAKNAGRDRVETSSGSVCASPSGSQAT